MLTTDGLTFAVVGWEPQASRVLGYLRYATVTGRSETFKVSGAEARQLLIEHQYLWHCPRRDCELPAVTLDRIARHFRPEDAAALLLETAQPVGIYAAAKRILQELLDHTIPLDRIGVTGSLLLERAGDDSDIDIVIYGRDAFADARTWVRDALKTGAARELTAEQWEATWQRRGRPMDLERYVWHESRKFNKAIVEDFRFDLNLVQDGITEPEIGRKRNVVDLTARVVDATRSFDWPATYLVDHPTIDEIQTYTATYFGQAVAGERIRARGIVEQLQDGRQRLLIGTDRDAQGHFLKVTD